MLKSFIQGEMFNPSCKSPYNQHLNNHSKSWNQCIVTISSWVLQVEVPFFHTLKFWIKLRGYLSQPNYHPLYCRKSTFSYFFSLSYQIHSAIHVRLYIQQNKALRFQGISKVNVFSIIQQDKSSWMVLVIEKTDLKFNRLWPLFPLNRLL